MRRCARDLLGETAYFLAFAMISLDLATILLDNTSSCIMDTSPADAPSICSDHECGMDPPMALIVLGNTVVSGVTELGVQAARHASPGSVLALALTDKTEELGDPILDLLSLRLALKALQVEPFLKKNSWKTAESMVHRGGKDPLFWGIFRRVATYIYIYEYWDGIHIRTWQAQTTTGNQFVPLSFETSGTWGLGMRELFAEGCKLVGRQRSADLFHWSAIEFMGHWRRRA
jgi:hypothetical protein